MGKKIKKKKKQSKGGEGNVTFPGKVIDLVLTLKEIKNHFSLEPTMSEYALGT